MPNWTQNTIRADGPEAALRAFMDAIKGLEDPIDFERIIPIPSPRATFLGLSVYAIFKRLRSAE